MNKLHIISILTLTICICSTVTAQQQTVIQQAPDSITLENLFKSLEADSDFKIFASGCDLTAKTPATYSRNASPADVLSAIFKDTQFKITVSGKNIFILPKRLLTDYLFDKSEVRTEGILSQLGEQETAESENLVYVIGDRYSTSVPRTVTLKGTLTDLKTGEPMPGVSVILKGSTVADVTDGNGRYTLKMPSGRQEIELSGIGIRNSRRNVMLYGDGVFNIGLFEDIVSLGEVTVVSGKIDNVKNTSIGVEKIQMDRIKNIPTAMGEVDILKVIQTLPGVKSVGEASSGFNVRGGATDQNLILFNNNTIYNANHMFGFFSVFNPDMIKDVEVYKSSIPAQYGGRISSVIDITSKDANKKKFKGSAGIGLITSKLNLEIPIIKERTSLLLDGRTTYSNWILRRLPEKSGYNQGTAGFYDIGTTFSHKINDRNNLNIYGYFSKDRFAFNPQQKYAYQNINASAKWRHILSDSLTAIYSAGFDHYDYDNTDTKNEFSAYRLSFAINQAFAAADFTRSVERHKFTYGFKTMLYSINSGNYDPVGELSLVNKDALQEDRALETAVYLGDEWTLTPEFSISAGVRYSMFNALGPRTYYKYAPDMIPYESTITDTLTKGANAVLKTYHGPELRFSARYMLQPNLSVKAGFNTMRQYIHKLSNTVVMSPTDTWKLSDVNIRPQTGWQAAAGLYFDSEKKIWETSVEAYYKRMNDYLDYRNTAQILMNHHIETDVLNTQGYAYGAELMVKKLTGKLNGWVSYTYSRTFLRQHDKLITNPVNNGNWYPTDYDKPHDFKLVGNYKLSQRYSFSFNVDYNTGRPTTIPAGRYYNSGINAWQVYYTDRNTYRIPDYFRTDLSFNIEPSHKLTLITHHTFSFGVYNLTGRENVYSVYYLSENGVIKGYKLSIFASPIPFVTYNIIF